MFSTDIDDAAAPVTATADHLAHDVRPVRQSFRPRSDTDTPALTRPKLRGVWAPGSNLRQLRAPRSLHATDRRARSWRRELILVIVLYLVYAAGRLASLGPVDAAIRNAQRVLDLERSLHVAPEHTVNSWLFSAPTWVQVASAYYYEVMHYAMTAAMLIWLYRLGPEVYRRARNWLVAMTFPALVVFWLFPVAPPRVIPGAVSHDIVALQHQYGWWGASGGTAPRGLGALVNGNAAMPSLHVGWALWVGWNLARSARNPIVRAFGYLYPTLTVAVVLGTGNHYLFDVLAGALLALVAKVVVDRAAARSRRRSTSAAPARPNVAGSDRCRPRRHVAPQRIPYRQGHLSSTATPHRQPRLRRAERTGQPRRSPSRRSAESTGRRRLDGQPRSPGVAPQARPQRRSKS